MDEFFTAETYYNEQMAEFAAEQEWEKMQEKLAPFDPYDDYDDQGNEDAGWEEGLFGWEQGLTNPASAGQPLFGANVKLRTRSKQFGVLQKYVRPLCYDKSINEWRI